MELNKSILLLLICSSLLSFFAEAICVRRNGSSATHANPEATGTVFSLGPALSFSRSALLPPVSSPIKPGPASAPSSPSLSPPVPSPSPPTSSPSPHNTPSALPSLSKNVALVKICGLTDYPAECVAAISPLLTGGIDPISVLKTGMQALHKSFEEAVAVATKLTSDPSSSAVVKDAVDTCLESFDSAMSDLNDALLAIPSHDIGRLSTMLSAAISYPDTCEEAFAEQPGLDSPMKEVDDKLTRLASINLAISASLHWS